MSAAIEPGKYVVDVSRRDLYGDTLGLVVTLVGPYRTMVVWPDGRGEQLEQNEHLEVAS